MRYVRQLRALGAVIAVAALALPVAASAHPSVYTGQAVVDDPDQQGNQPMDQARYMVTNHNNTFVLRETNEVEEADHRGVMSYAILPGFVRETMTVQAQLAMSSGAQAHHICDVPALTNDSTVDGDPGEIAVLTWQGSVGPDPEDPFYNYVPFQKVRAGEQDPQFAADVRGLDDTPSNWIGEVRRLTGVDLTQAPADPVAAQTWLEQQCEALPGANQDSFVPADRIQTSARSLQLAMIQPLETSLAAANSAKAASDTAAAAAKAEAAAAKAEAQAAMLAAAPPQVTLNRARTAARRFASRGLAVTITGQPLRMTTVRVQVTQKRAKALGLKSRVLGTTTATIAADGSSVITVKPTKAAAAALRKTKRSLAFSVSAIAGQPATATGTFTR
jgi:hypothetical protein